MPAAGGLFSSIVAGPENSLWYCDRQNDKIARISTSGQVTEWSSPQPGYLLALGPDNNLWYVDATDEQIYRMVP